MTDPHQNHCDGCSADLPNAQGAFCDECMEDLGLQLWDDPTIDERWTA